MSAICLIRNRIYILLEDFDNDDLIELSYCLLNDDPNHKVDNVHEVQELVLQDLKQAAKFENHRIFYQCLK